MRNNSDSAVKAVAETKRENAALTSPSSSDAELVASLLANFCVFSVLGEPRCQPGEGMMCNACEAASRLEALVAENALLREQVKESDERTKEARLLAEQYRYEAWAGPFFATNPDFAGARKNRPLPWESVVASKDGA